MTLELSISVKHLIKSHMPLYTVPEILLSLWDTWTNIIMALGFSKQWISVHCSSQHEVMQPLYFGLAGSISVACVRPRTSNRAGDRPLQLLVFNEEFLVSASHQLATKTSDIKEGGLLSQVVFCRPCKTTTVHYRVYGATDGH